MDRYFMQGIGARAAAAMLALVFAASAGAAGWRWYDPQQTLPLAPAGLDFAADGSLWTFSYDAVRRTDAAGTTIAGVTDLASAVEYDRGVLLADGGAILRESPGGSCAVARVDARLRRLWTVSTPHWCRDYAATPDGRVWLADQQNLVRIDADGQIISTIPLGDAAEPVTNVSLAVTPDGGVVLVAQAAGSQQAAIRRYGSAGELRWSSNASALELNTVLVAADGSVLLAGHSPNAGYTIGNPTVIKLAANGGLQWRTATQGRADFVSDAALASDGAVIIAGNGAVHRIDAGGALSWTREPCTDASGFQRVVALPGAGAALGCSISAGSRLVRLASSGAILSTTALPLAYLWPPAARADGLVLLAGYGIGNLRTTQLVAVDASGAIVTAPATEPSAPEARTLLDQVVADGSTYVMSYPNRDFAVNLYLSKIGSGGTLAWRRAMEPGAQLWNLSANATRLCTTQRRWGTGSAVSTMGFACHAAADGAPLWQSSLPITPIPLAPGTVLPPPFGGTPPPPHAAQFSDVLNDGTLVFFRSEPAAHEFLSFDPAGRPIGAARLQGRLFSVAIHPAGVIVASVGTADGKSALMRYDLQGNATRIGDSPNPLNAIDIADGSVAADGSVIAIAHGPSLGAWPSGARELWSIGTDGNVLWKRAYTGGTGPVDIVRVGGAIYLAEYPGYDGAAVTRISRIAPQDGAMLWQTEATTPANASSGAKFSVSADGAFALLATERKDHLQLRRYDAKEGLLTAEWLYPCYTFCGEPRAIALDSDRVARIVLNVADAVRGRVPAVFAVPTDKFSRFIVNDGRIATRDGPLPERVW
ncbi:hypothetical protein [Tahibacter sp.]|uniref:hypothetical protein n=1 Tax=Tahibacter sp. TaxID=2056211 RepID=UPI0028C3EAF5|nr:hypothetical protein [Tahibacter sp.]